MVLFNSYLRGIELYCDQTELPSYPDPDARVLCHQMENLCFDCASTPVNNGFVLCDCGDSWNCKLCANDVPFWIPFEVGDFFDFQFQQPNRLPVSCENGWLPENLLSPTDFSFASFEIRTCCNNTVLEITPEMFEVIAPQQFVGKYNLTDYAGTIQRDIQQIRFDLGAIATYLVGEGLEPCFYFTFQFSADTVCLPDAEGKTEFCSEPFKLVPCEQPTTLVESIYPKLDCFGYYYGSDLELAGGNGTLFNYRNRIRIPSSFERTNFTITKETIGATLKTTSAQYCETWLLRSFQLPETFVKYLVNVFTGRDIFVNGREYQIQGEIAKNNETGSQWFLEINFERCECDKSLTCE